MSLFCFCFPVRWHPLLAELSSLTVWHALNMQSGPTQAPAVHSGSERVYMTGVRACFCLRVSVSKLRLHCVRDKCVNEASWHLSLAHFNFPTSATWSKSHFRTSYCRPDIQNNNRQYQHMFWCFHHIFQSFEESVAAEMLFLSGVRCVYQSVLTTLGGVHLLPQFLFSKTLIYFSLCKTWYEILEHLGAA